MDTAALSTIINAAQIAALAFVLLRTRERVRELREALREQAKRISELEVRADAVRQRLDDITNYTRALDYRLDVTFDDLVKQRRTRGAFAEVEEIRFDDKAIPFMTKKPPEVEPPPARDLIP